MGHSISTSYDLLDGPPNLWYLVGHPERHYYYGYLNLMCQQTVGLQGVPGLGLPWYAKLQSRDWVQVQDFTGQNLKKQRIYDIRAYDAEDPEAPRGKIFQYSRASGSSNERFYVAFHGGTGIDAQDFDDDGIPMVRSRGLEIYHCVGNDMYDIESAFGNYSNISATALPVDVESRDPSTFLPTWGTVDAAAGRDNYDYWTSSGQARTDFANHEGYVFDFFSKDLGAFSQWEKEEFSFRSNPNGFWYASYSPPSGEPLVMMRVNPQTVANSMVVRIREQHNDAPVPYAVVDFLSAPYEDILSPGVAAGEHYVYGHPMTISWANYYGGSITQVDVLFSSEGGGAGTYELIGQVDTATGGHAFEWTPDVITSAGKIKLVFHSAIEPAKTCDEESGYNFEITAPFEDVIAPNGGESLVVGAPTTISWSHDHVLGQPSGIINTVDIFFLPGGEEPAREIALGVDATAAGLEWAPTLDDLSAAGKIRITSHNVNAAYVASDESDGIFAVDAGVAKFVNVSGSSGLSYTGEPYSSVALDYNGDGRGDLLVTMMGEVVRLFPGLPPALEDPDAPRFAQPEQLPSAPLDARATVVGDFDNQNGEDIFVAHDATPKLYCNDGGGFSDATTAMGLAGLADMSIAACWVDYDRDGWLDLYVVRGSATGVPSCSNLTGLQHRLFRNATRTGGGFVDVTVSAGLTGIANIASLSASAADIDNDGDLDIFVAAASLPGVPATNSLLLINDGVGHYVNRMAEQVAVAVQNCPAAEWADINNDGAPDLIVASDSDSPRILFNDGTGHFLGAPENLGAPGGQSGLKVFDQDLDGWLDVLSLPRNSQQTCRLFTNLHGGAAARFVETTREAGLMDLGAAMAAVAADFNGDGDADLYLGRATVGNKFLYRCGNRAGGGTQGHNHLKLKLDAPDFANNSQGIGARVRVTAGSLVQTRSPDGGSGRGSQGDRILTFGLGDYAGPVSATVFWPGGWETAVSWPTPPTAVQVITDNTTPTVSNTSATCMADPSTGDLTWEFTWDTNVSCNPALDAVTLEQIGLPCLPGYTTLTPSNASHTYQAKATGGYRHKFVLEQGCYAGCRMKYAMTSLAGSRGGTSAQKSKRIDACLSPQ